MPHTARLEAAEQAWKIARAQIDAATTLDELLAAGAATDAAQAELSAANAEYIAALRAEFPESEVQPPAPPASGPTDAGLNGEAGPALGLGEAHYDALFAIGNESPVEDRAVLDELSKHGLITEYPVRAWRPSDPRPWDPVPTKAELTPEGRALLDWWGEQPARPESRPLPEGWERRKDGTGIYRRASSECRAIVAALEWVKHERAVKAQDGAS